MKIKKDGLDGIIWENVQNEIAQQGYSILENVLDDEDCSKLMDGFTDSTLYRKTVEMERYRFGSGTYKYFKYPLPSLLSQLREDIYPKLVPVANQWMEDLKMDVTFPENLAELQKKSALNGQHLATPLILKYGKGGYNTLHQDLYGDVYFPMQAVLFLNDPETDYTGGEFVMTQQVPRAQSKAIVLRPKKGSMLIFTTNFRPMKGKKGHYRVTMKHGVSEVYSGERYTLGIIFHDATS
ncbi:2OG-Fe(II) oxygenase [Flagellimonas hymeniacidonis]|uniref:2OG-Fe(II) oxygenase n=1 Tax=Flagellimonas hymeniacidonis TaxID=2603628 RepID=A0A5C8V5N2_9FLAO|nr:2OG-Fe(II) oxygenase [Flagellimonas hymeniacidonis]TXN37364.1 2OG-Fe(II) oxygenase [Flagellimonas hymeniacidonis]